MWAWGANNNGELGQNVISGQASAVPVEVMGTGGTGFLTNATAISSNHDGALATKNDCSVWT